MRGPGLLASVWWLTRATQGRLLRTEAVIAIGKKDVVQRGHLEKPGIKKAPPEERAAREKFVGVSYKRRLVLRGGVEAVIAKKVARLEHDGGVCGCKVREDSGKANFQVSVIASEAKQSVLPNPPVFLSDQPRHRTGLGLVAFQGLSHPTGRIAALRSR